MQYDFDVNLLVERYLPTFLRKEKHLSWLKVLFTPFVWLKNSFLAYITKARNEQMQNGQVIRLETLLNDLYDNDFRRIRIADAFSTSVFLVLSNIADTIISDSNNLIISDDADYNFSVDFVVKVSGGGADNTFVLSNAVDTIISNATNTVISNNTSGVLSDIERIVKKYKTAGKTFAVENN